MKNLMVISAIFLALEMSSHHSKAQEKGVVTDINGNVYKTVVIGNLEWMAENLKATTYKTGEEIENVQDLNIWVNLTTGAYCWYNNNKSNGGIYGALYNWYAVNTGNLCPSGWRVSTESDWVQLEAFVDSKYASDNAIWLNVHSRGYDAGINLKSKNGWDSECKNNDKYGFNALPGGERVSNLNFLTLGESGFWWTSTISDSTRAYYRRLINCDNGVFRGPHPKFVGFSVRCIRDK